MIITIFDILSDKFNKFWELRKKDRGAFIIYLIGIISLLSIVPFYFLCSYVIGIDLFGFDLQALRAFIAITLPGICFYNIGVFVSFYIDRKNKN